MEREVTIERLGHRGDGVAKGPVYAPRTLPGEVVRGALDGDRIPTPKIVTPSAHRVTAPCRHYRGCGGCQVMHADAGFVADWKAGLVRDALAGQGLSAPMRPVATSPDRSRRRASLSGRRTKSGAIVGFHGRASETVVPVPDCLILTDALRAVLPVLEALTRAGASRRDAVTFAVTDTGAGVDVAVSGGKPLDRALQTTLAEIAGSAGLARLSWGDEPVVTARVPAVPVGGVPVVPPPGAFLQATEAGEAALIAAVTEAVDAQARVIDLFAGCGTFSLPLAQRAAVHAVEGQDALLSALTAAGRSSPGLKPLTTARRDLFRDPVPAADLAAFDAIVIDPPRAGAAEQAVQIARSGVARVASVSCQPATFARDAATLVAGGYVLNWVQVVDQFRWSTHVELAAQFSRP